MDKGATGLTHILGMISIKKNRDKKVFISNHKVLI